MSTEIRDSGEREVAGLIHNPEEGVSVDGDLGEVRIALTTLRGSRWVSFFVLMFLAALWFAGQALFDHDTSIAVVFAGLWVCSNAIVNKVLTRLTVTGRSVRVEQVAFGRTFSSRLLPLDAIDYVRIGVSRWFKRSELILELVDGEELRLKRGTFKDQRSVQWLLLKKIEKLPKLEASEPAVPEELQRLRSARERAREI